MRFKWNNITLRRIVLAWFMLFIGSSIATSFVNPGSMQLVCSASGAMKLVSLDQDSSDSGLADSGMQCSLCASVIAVFPALETSVQGARLTHITSTTSSEVVVAHVAEPPMPPRGPPAPHCA